MSLLNLFKKMKKTDWFLMLGITLIYAGFALLNLGDRQVPETGYVMPAGEEVIFEFDEAPVSFSYFISYIEPGSSKNFSLKIWDEENQKWQTAQEISVGYVYTWQEVSDWQSGTRIRLYLQNGRVDIAELCFKDSEGNLILPVNKADYAAMFDEQVLRPDRSSFRNSMYFDEIYHARTAYEYIHEMYSYENTHPPLGKILISVGIIIFGMNPFGWRIVGTVFGIFMVPLMYLFGKRITDSTVGASLAAVIFAFDFMHFVQTRIATIDVYITFFVIIMYALMYQYLVMCRRGDSLKARFFILGACGISMGLGVACKWTGVYAGIGLGLLFLWQLIFQFRNNREQFVRETGKLIGFCLVFFVAVPAGIYLLSYLPFRDHSEDGLIIRMLNNQRSMFRYHSTLTATHPYGSPWYQWPVMNRPVWYYSGIVDELTKEGISAFGNPLVWWVGIPAFFYMLFRIVYYRDNKSAFLVVGYLAQYLPWVFVSRQTFMYHYFPSVPFVVLMIVYGLQCLTGGKEKRFLKVSLIYGIGVVALFLLFYPVLSGMPINAEFVHHWLRWREGWVLVK